MLHLRKAQSQMDTDVVPPPHRQGVVVGWSQGCIVGGGFLLPEHTQGVLLVATRLAREGNGWDV